MRLKSLGEFQHKKSTVKFGFSHSGQTREMRSRAREERNGSRLQEKKEGREAARPERVTTAGAEDKERRCLRDEWRSKGAPEGFVMCGEVARVGVITEVGTM